MAPSDEPNSTRFEFETFEDDGTASMVVKINGKWVGFHCRGWICGAIG
jgi:hypothetical protein